MFVKQRPIAAGDKVEAATNPTHHEVAQRHRLPQSRAFTLGAEHGLRDVLICGACPSGIDRPEHFDEMAPALGCESNVWCRSMINESISEAEQRVDAIMEKWIDRREGGYRATGRLTVKGNSGETLTGEDEAEIEAFLSRPGADRIGGDCCRDQARYDYRCQNDCGRIDCGAPEDVGTRGG